MLKICPKCGKEFDAKGPNAKFCNPKCQREFKKKESLIVVEKVCKTCGKTFKTADNRKEYCCEECLKNSKKKHIQLKICPNCGKVFEPKSSRTIFCCRDCYEVFESKQKFKDVEGAIVCKECGMMGHNLLKHIGTKHSSVEEYCQKHNCTRSDLISEQSHNILSERQKLLMERGVITGFTSENNPSKGDDCKNGRNSPYSMNFRGYDGLTDDEKQQKINELLNRKIESTNSNFNNPKTLEYYIKRGFNKEEAQEKLIKSQQTFTLEKCIEKYGEEEGRKRWMKRQEKWLNNYKKLNYSRISQDLFWNIYNLIDDKEEIYFATLSESKKRDDSGLNHEYTLYLNKGYIKPDYLDKKQNKIIEFDGAYWHGFSDSKKENDLERDKRIIESGYKLFKVDELDYRKNHDKVIQECLEFLKS